MQAFGQSAEIVSGLAAYLEEKAPNIVGALKKMPAENYDYVGADGQRSFRQQAAHVIGSNYDICALLDGRDIEELPDPGVTGDASKDELVGAMKESFQFCRKVLSRVGDDALVRRVETPGGSVLDVAHEAFFLAGNWAGHYAHFATHLRDHDIMPPSEIQH